MLLHGLALCGWPGSMEYAYCLWKYRKDRVCLYQFFFKLQIHVRKKNFLLTFFPRISYLALFRDQGKTAITKFHIYSIASLSWSQKDFFSHLICSVSGPIQFSAITGMNLDFLWDFSNTVFWIQIFLLWLMFYCIWNNTMYIFSEAFTSERWLKILIFA